MSRTTYAGDPFWLRGNITTCVHCGCVQEAHHSDGRCYTVEEIVNRLRFYQRTRRWPGPDEGCEEEGGPGP
jgi:hypothetical protein